MDDIKNRDDVHKLVYTFYGKIRRDDFLGPIFNKQIPNEKWPAHLEKMIDFWETNLFGIPKFKGNPKRAHAEVDKNNNYGITQQHFGHWVDLWFSTVDELFTGSIAETAKTAAKRMSLGLYLGIYNERP